MSIDLWLPHVGVAVELKYRTRTVTHDYKGELFALSNQAAHPQGRYDFLKDIQRLELVSRQQPDVRVGFAVFLTNDAAYWRPALRSKTVDAAFRLDDGRRLTGAMAWSRETSDGTIGNRRELIRLDGSYELQWQDYAALNGGRHGRFRYLAVRIPYE